jgi:Zn-dependent protease with chaperone function
MIAGFLPGLRTVLISDRILDELPRDQTAMVLLHEAAHLRRRHVPLRMACVLPAWAVGMTVTRLAGDQSWAGALGTFAGVLITLCALRLVAYRTEFDADAQACRLAERLGGAVPGVPSSRHDAAAALRAALLRVTQETPSSRKPSWLHPGLAARLDRLDAQAPPGPERGHRNAAGQPVRPAT